MPDYIVRPGDTLRSIAIMYSIPLLNIIAANPDVANPDHILVGQIIRIPEGYSRRTINVNGFAAPDIDNGVLSDTVPYLTYLSIYGYNVKPDGTLVTIDDADLVQLSRQAGVGPLMVISNIDETGEASSELAHTILMSEVIQITLIKNIIDVVKSKNYFGLNINFDNIDPSDRELLTKFFQSVTQNLFSLGYIVVASDFIAVNPNRSTLLYDTIDFGAYSEYVNQVFIIVSYATQRPRLPPMAVAPLDQLKRVLDYSVSIIPSQNILLGMTNYALDWTLPYNPATVAKRLPYPEALALSRQKAAYVWFDQISQSANFFYTDGSNRQHVVWLYDELSIRLRLELIRAYNLGGVSFFMVDDFPVETYITLNSMYEIRKVL